MTQRLPHAPEPTEMVATMFDGQQLRVLVPEIVGDDLCAHGLIEPDVTTVLEDYLRPGMVFFDVGAHYGYFTLLAARLVAPGGRVVAFEPSRATGELLRRNTAGVPGVVVETRAVLDRDGTVEIHDFGPRNSALNTVLSTARVPETERRDLRASTYRVPAISLDAYAAEQSLSPDVVKLDAEGAELAILRGMHRLLTHVRPVVIMETGDYAGMAAPATAESLDVLAASGYTAFEFADGRLRRHTRLRSYGYGNLFFVPEEADPMPALASMP